MSNRKYRGGYFEMPETPDREGEPLIYQSFSDASSYKKIKDPKSSSFWSWWKGGENKKTKIDELNRDYAARQRYPRIIDRVGDSFNQSAGKTFIGKRMNRSERNYLYVTDWFHTLIDAPTYRIFLIVTLYYVFVTFFFSCCYYYLSVYDECSMDFPYFVDSFLFSLETMATIGFGAPNKSGDIYFGHCMSVAVILTMQCCIRLIVEAAVIGIVYSRLSRPSSRASTIIFSDKAVIRRIRGRLYFMFQLCELRKHQLVEAHVRLYIIKHEVDLSSLSLHHRRQQQQHHYLHQSAKSSVQSTPSLPPSSSSTTSSFLPFNQTNRFVFVQSCSMRLNHPNDELGAMLLLMLPQVVVHEIDITSPLMPPPVWISGKTGEVIRWNPPVYRTLRRRKGGDYGVTRYEHPNNPVVTNSYNSKKEKTNKQKKKQIDGIGEEQRENDDEEEGEEDYNLTRGAETGTITREAGGAENDYSDNDIYDLYDIEAMSNIEFPSVSRRGVEIYSSSAHSPVPPLPHATSVAQTTANSPLPLTPRRNNPVIPRTPPPSSLKDKNTNSILESASQKKFPPQSVGAPLTPLKAAHKNLQHQFQQPTDQSMTGEKGNLFPPTTGPDLESPGLQRFNTDLNYLSTANPVLINYQSRDSSMRSNPAFSNKYNFQSGPVPITTTGGGTGAGKKNPTITPLKLPMQFPHSSTQPAQSLSKTDYYHLNDSLVNHPPATNQTTATNTHLPHPHQQNFHHSPYNDSALHIHDEEEEEAEDDEDEEEPEWQSDEKYMIQRYLQDRNVEIIAIVEGVDAATGGNLQARHSYTCDDLEWDKTFVNCIFNGSGNAQESDSEEFEPGPPGNMYVDFDYFHSLRSVSKDAAYPGPIASNV
jgi:hypothetical protein